MLATAKVSRPPTLNRRRRVRQKVHAPAYASFVGVSDGGMIDLYEVLNISEVGVAIQCPAQLETDQTVTLCLDLAESAGQITSLARVIWSDSEGRAGLVIAPLPNPALHWLREWLFLNAIAGAANSASFELEAPPIEEAEAELRPNYTDTLNAAHAVQREAESLRADLDAVLNLIALRSQSLLRASGAAIALAGDYPATMVCRASAGEMAPPVGAVLQVGSGFSGECVRTGTLLRCDDTETDTRVDRESCRALGIRSMLAVPVRQAEKVVGLLEVFSAAAGAFDEKEGAVLQRFAEAIALAIDRAAKKNEPAPPFAPRGGVLFAQAPEKAVEKPEPKEASADHDADKVGGIRLPRAHLYLLMCAAATIFLALGFITAPWIQPWVQAKFHGRGSSAEETVLASGPAVESAKALIAAPSVDSASLEQLRQMAEHSDAAAEDRLGRLYAEGDEKLGIAADDKQAAHWFTSAAEHGSVSAQYKLGLLYWGGHHGLPKDVNKAYFWAVLARAGGQEGSKDLAAFIANGMTRTQAAAIEQQAEIWYRQHEPQTKAGAGR